MISIDLLRQAGATEAFIARVLELEAANARERKRINQRDCRARHRLSGDIGDTSRARAALSKKDPSPSYSDSQNPQSKREPDFFDVPPVEDFGEPIDEDPRAKLYRIGKTLLASFGMAESRTGKMLGYWLKQRDDPDGLLAAIEYARNANVAEPIAYISALVNGGHRNGSANLPPGPARAAAVAHEMAEEIRQRKRALGLPVDERTSFP